MLPKSVFVADFLWASLIKSFFMNEPYFEVSSVSSPSSFIEFKRLFFTVRFLENAGLSGPANLRKPLRNLFSRVSRVHLEDASIHRKEPRARDYAWDANGRKTSRDVAILGPRTGLSVRYSGSALQHGPCTQCIDFDFY